MVSIVESVAQDAPTRKKERAKGVIQETRNCAAVNYPRVATGCRERDGVFVPD